MSQQVKDTLKTCILCQRVGVTAPHAVQDMQTTSHHDYGIDYRWGLNFVGDLPESRLGNKYTLIMIDYYSKWIEATPCKMADALITTVREVLLNLIARYGTPGEVLTDNGSAFKGEFEQFLARRKVVHRSITPMGCPGPMDWLSERSRQCSMPSRSTLLTNGMPLDWDTEGLAAILVGYRCTPHAATGFNPAQILFAQYPAVNADHWVSRMGQIDYDGADAKPEEVAMELLERSVIAAEMSPTYHREPMLGAPAERRRLQSSTVGFLYPEDLPLQSGRPFLHSFTTRRPSREEPLAYAHATKC